MHAKRRQLNDLTGQTFGLLTVQGQVERKPGQYLYNWICKCACGSIRSVRKTHLLLGKTKSCGCLSEKANDLTGRKFGMLIANARSIRKGKNRQSYWECNCDCGSVCTVAHSQLVNGSTKSCGCLRKLNARNRFSTHGKSKTRVHHLWSGMLARCNNPNQDNYCRYGARGISVCQRWHQFEAFLADMGEPPPGASLDRIDNDGNYEPGNVKWSTKHEQERNKRTNRWIEYNGERHVLADWARLIGIGDTTLRDRLDHGWTIEAALTTPALGSGHSKLGRESKTSQAKKNRQWKSDLQAYSIWHDMIKRCIKPKAKNYHDYGGRGIKVCERWLLFDNFYADMGDPPMGLSLNRIDNDGDYCPDNCRWSTAAEQNRNRRGNHWVEHNGKRMVLSDWSVESGVNRAVLLKRLQEGQSPAEALCGS